MPTLYPSQAKPACIRLLKRCPEGETIRGRKYIAHRANRRAYIAALQPDGRAGAWIEIATTKTRS